MKRERQEEGLCPEERVKSTCNWLKQKWWLWVTFLSIHVCCCHPFCRGLCSSVCSSDLSLTALPSPVTWEAVRAEREVIAQNHRYILLWTWSFLHLLVRSPVLEPVLLGEEARALESFCQWECLWEYFAWEKWEKRSFSRLTLSERKQGWMLLVLPTLSLNGDN